MSLESLLQLLQLSDSQVPIGAAAHSFGLETLVEEGFLQVSDLKTFFADHLAETGRMEVAACRAAHRLALSPTFAGEWHRLNAQMSARKPTREGRAASLTLGRRLLFLATEMTTHPRLCEAQSATGDCHHASAFGLVGGTLGLPEDTVAAVYVHHTLMGMVSACQRLLPLGQQAASRLLWRLKPAVLAAAQSDDWETVSAFTPLLEIAGMRHPDLATRLFIS